MSYLKSSGRFLFLAALVVVVLFLSSGKPGSYQLPRLFHTARTRDVYREDTKPLPAYRSARNYPPGVVAPPFGQPLPKRQPTEAREPNYDPNRPVLRDPAPERVIAPADLYGKWGGTEILANRGSCQIGMDIERWKGMGYGAYTVVHCMPTETTQPRMNPGFTVLVGAMKDGQLRLVATKTNITAQHSCVIRALSLRPSVDDPDDMLATWVDTCSSATMHVTRVR